MSDKALIYINTNNLSKTESILKLKAKLRLLDVVIREVIKAIADVEREVKNED